MGAGYEDDSLCGLPYRHPVGHVILRLSPGHIDMGNRNRLKIKGSGMKTTS